MGCAAEAVWDVHLCASFAPFLNADSSHCKYVLFVARLSALFGNTLLCLCLNEHFICAVDPSFPKPNFSAVVHAMILPGLPMFPTLAHRQFSAP